MEQQINSAERNRSIGSHISWHKLAVVIPILLVILIFTASPTLGFGDSGQAFAQDESAGRKMNPQAVNSFSSAGTISFQGELRDQATGSALPDGEYQMRFAIYDAVSGGNKYWPAPTPDYEDHPGVGVQGGLFNVLLGSNITIPADVFSDGSDRYLQIWVCKTAGSTCADFDDLGRLPISSTAYTLGIVPGTVINSSADFGLRVNNAGNGGTALEGHSTAATGITWGVFGSTASESDLAAGVIGSATANTGETYGVYGSSNSDAGAGVYGTGAVGVYAESDTLGIYGLVTSLDDNTFGVAGRTYAAGSSAGVFGESLSDQIDSYGVRGYAYYGTGVYGESFGGPGVIGTGSVGVYGSGYMTGTVGISSPTNGIGVYGVSHNPTGWQLESAGVLGESDVNHGVLGATSGDGMAGVMGIGHSFETSFGVVGETSSSGTNSSGVYGLASFGVGATNGVFGETYSDNDSSTGVYGYASNEFGSAVAMWARSDGTGDIYRGYGANYPDLEFKVTNDGEVYADGTFHGSGADFAELLPATEGLEPGDVLVIGPDGQLTRSTAANQSTVVGVYSTEPGFLGGSVNETEQEGKVPLAVVGIVPVKISTENGTIQPGDLLVAAATPGHAMKAGDNPAIGTVIGKALEAFEGETGLILMLVILQ